MGEKVTDLLGRERGVSGPTPPFRPDKIITVITHTLVLRTCRTRTNTPDDSRPVKYNGYSPEKVEVRHEYK